MITNTGKSILAKYLIGQAPAYASYMALGCGAKPVSGSLGDYKTQESLEFEMFRVPIISRGYVKEDGVSKIVLTAEMPTEERYEISEIGIYSAGSNPYAGSYDSKLIFSFADTENWWYHTLVSSTDIPVVTDPLDSQNNNIIDVSYDVFQTNTDNRVFTNSNRVSRYERCRFLNNTIMIIGDDADISRNLDGSLTVDSGNHIHLSDASVDLNKNSPNDELRLAFSLINKNGTSSTIPDVVRLIVEFASEDDSNAATYQSASFEVDVYDENYGSIPLGAQTQDFATNRYFVIKKTLQDLVKSSGFSWNAVRFAKIYVSVIKDDAPSSNFYIGLDAMRLERTVNANPLYGLTGYSVIKNSDASTVIKSVNTTNYVEFRFAMDVE
jgi:hypothetical protein